KGRALGTFSYLFLRRVFLHTLQSLIYVFDLYAKVIKAAAALLFIVVQDCQFEVAVGQMNGLFAGMSRMAPAMQVFKAKDFDIEIRQLLRVLCQYCQMTNLCHLTLLS